MRPVFVDIRKKSYKMKVCEVRMERLDYTVFLRCLYVRVNRLKLVQKAVSVNIRRLKSEELERRVSSGNCTENKNKSSLKKVKKYLKSKGELKTTSLSTVSSSFKQSSPQLITNPKTIKERMMNRDFINNMNKGHEDDLFQKRTLKWEGKLLKVKSEDSSSEDESENRENTCHRSRSPCGWTQCLNISEMHSETLRRNLSPPRRRCSTPVRLTPWQQEAIIHKRLKEMRKRRIMKKNITF